MSDPYGLYNEKSFDVQVIDCNDAPVITEVAYFMVLEDTAIDTDLSPSIYATDIDGDTLSYSIKDYFGYHWDVRSVDNAAVLTLK